MTNSLSQSFDRFATTSVLAIMLSGLPLAGVMFFVNSGVI